MSVDGYGVNKATGHLGLNQTKDIVPASIAGQAAALAAGRAAEITGPSVTVITTIDGTQVLLPRNRVGPSNKAHQVSDDELLAMDITPDRFPVCEVPRCKGEGRYQIRSGSGRPLSVNAAGQLVSGDIPAVSRERMSPNDTARARAGVAMTELASIGIGDGTVAPARQAAKSHVDVCQIHQSLPPAPTAAAPVRFVSGPYKGYRIASRRAAAVDARTHEHPVTVPVKDASGAEVWYVRGDDGVKGYAGKLEEI
jgi:hypothetical protein